MWSVAPSDDYLRRHKRYEKKHSRELAAVLDIRILDFEFVSDFELRISDFHRKGGGPTMADPKAKHASVAEMVRRVSDDPQFADAFDRRVNRRRLVKHLFAMRSAEGLSQKDIAERIGCSQSRISKLESGNDDDLRLADLAAYLGALDLDLCLVFGQKDSTIVNKIKYHAVAIKRLLAELVKLAQIDKQIAAGVAGFHGEAFFNLIKILRDSVKDLPRREDGTAFVDIEIETAQAAAGHLAEPDESETSDGSPAAHTEMAAAH